MEDKKRGIYIHMPFCVQKCNYCSFLSFDAEGSPRREYIEALSEEIKLRAQGAGESAGSSKSREADMSTGGNTGSRSIRACAADRGPIDTVYIGGGTPSVMDISQLSELVKLLRRSYDIKEDAEFTLEANPATLGRKDGVMLAKLQAYRFMGINRISMGVQSMDNDRLHYLGRLHTAENIARDMELLRRKGFDNINLDLIFSVPGESAEDALEDLEKILKFEPEHVSCYSLQIEEGTPFGCMAEAGELTEVPDEEDRETYHRICRALRDAGYEHYEISNFAKVPGGGRGAGFDGAESKGTEGFGGADKGTAGFDGSESKGTAGFDGAHNGDVQFDDAGRSAGMSPYRSKHNSLYWNLDEYIGLGLGASGFAGGVRYKNTTDLDEYISELKAGRLPVAEEHVNIAFDSISEAVFTGLRRREGITYEEAVRTYLDTIERERSNGTGEKTGESDGSGAEEMFWQIFRDAKEEAGKYADRGLLVIDSEGLRLTEQGIDISNSIMSLFV